MAAETVCGGAPRRQLRADAGSRDDQASDGEDGFLTAMFEMMYIPHGLESCARFEHALGGPCVFRTRIARFATIAVAARHQIA